MNIIIVGAKAEGRIADDASVWNNIKQASHNDLCTLKAIYDCHLIQCYDPLYPSNKSIDGIEYISNSYDLGDTSHFLKDGINIIIEFCNLLDENFINHSETNRQSMDMPKYSDYHTVILACGCMWDQGFPLKCISYVESGRLRTPTDPYNIDNLLYTVSCKNLIDSFESEEGKADMYPFVLGMYQSMGTFMWRGCQNDEYRSEHILRSFCDIVGVESFNLNERDSSELQRFVDGALHWNNLKWSIRKHMSNFAYGF